MGLFSRFLNCINCTKSRKASHIFAVDQRIKGRLKNKLFSPTFEAELCVYAVTLFLAKFRVTAYFFIV